MIKRGYKLIICVVLVSALLTGIGSAFASAEPAIVTRAKAGVAAAMLAANLFLHPIDVALSEPYASAVDPEGRIEWVETFPEYLERSKIRVYPDVVTIDGVAYTDIWLGPEAANTLRLKGLDFASAYNILNNQSSAITYANGAGYAGDTPFYSVDGLNITPHVPVNPPDSGTYAYRYDVYTNSEDESCYQIVQRQIANPPYRVNTYAWIWSASGAVTSSYFPYDLFMMANSNGTVSFCMTYNNPQGYYILYTSPTPEFTADPFSFDYTSGVIDEPIAVDDGLLMRIPSEHSGSTAGDSYDIHDLINIYPQVATPEGHTIEIDPDLNPDFETDIDLGNNIGDLIRTILILLDVLDNIEVEFAPEPETPEPGPVEPDPAIPDTPVSDQDGTWLDQLLRWIKQAIDTISQSIIDAQNAIQNEIQNLAETISEIPEQILEDIETGPSKVFRKALDVLKTLFMPLLLPIKAMMSLWHYVVEWIQSISSPFTWIFGVMSGTSYNMVLPIYAVLAGSICIAIYKALGR